MIMMITILILYSDQTKVKKTPTYFFSCVVTTFSSHHKQHGHHYDRTNRSHLFPLSFPKKVLFLLRLNSRMIRSSKLTYLTCVRVSSKMRKKNFFQIFWWPFSFPHYHIVNEMHYLWVKKYIVSYIAIHISCFIIDSSQRYTCPPLLLFLFFLVHWWFRHGLVKTLYKLPALCCPHNGSKFSNGPWLFPIYQFPSLMSTHPSQKKHEKNHSSHYLHKIDYTWSSIQQKADIVSFQIKQKDSRRQAEDMK